MVDPNDFVTKDENEGNVSGNPKAGQEDVGGLSTKDAEESYKKAAAQHFNDPEESKRQKIKTKNKEKKNEKKKPPSLPQIGSIQDDEITVDD